MHIIDTYAPVRKRDCFKGTSLVEYHERNEKRWQKVAQSIKRVFTFYSPLLVLSLAAVTLPTIKFS